ncbi:DUF5133 domain-containing protein [Streptomyces sp. MS19]|uniref:DUF5133 domain-containing protein n=1 Tax=Streptomyces sp. MS19 TaxID=3385972 RepID=UPI00399FB66B
MMMAHPAVLRNLVEEYEALVILRDDASSPDVTRRLEDVTYTLCVSTGTRTAEDALAAAHRQLAGTEPAGSPVLSGA